MAISISFSPSMAVKPNDLRTLDFSKLCKSLNLVLALLDISKKFLIT